MLRQDLPLDLVVLADLGLGEDHAALGRLHRVDADGFAEFMRGLNPRAVVGAGPSALTLAFPDPRAFRPEALAERVPDARALLALRGRLSQRGLERSEVEAAIAELPEGSPLRVALAGVVGGAAAPSAAAPAASAETVAPAAPVAPAPPVAPPPPAAGTESGSLDAIFDLVDVSGTPPPAGAPPAAPSRTPAARALDRLVGMLGAARSGQAGSAAQSGLAAVVDEALGDTLRGVLADPALRALEQAWTGLRFLVRRVDFRTGVRLHVLPTTRPRLTSHAREVLGPFAESERLDGRVVLALADFDLAGDAEGLEIAAALASVAAEMQSPLVAGADPRLFGIDRFPAIQRVENLAEVLGDDAHAGWNELRSSDDARWLALTANRFVLRLPYGAEADPVRGFRFEEHTDESVPEYRWGRGIWALGEQVAASFARCGWGVAITGQDEDTRVADLLVRLTRLRTGEIVPSPLETLLAERRALEFSEAGVIALLAPRGADFAFLASAPMVHRPGTGGAVSTADARRSSLPFMLFVAQVMAWFAHLDGSGRFGSDAERREALARGIEFLARSEEGPTLEAAVSGNSIVFTPWRAPLRGLPDFTLDVGDRP